MLLCSVDIRGHPRTRPCWLGPDRDLRLRGVKVAGRVTRDSDPTVVREAREAIAPRYLGETRGAAFVESCLPGVVIRLPIASARAWDLEAALPPTNERST